MSNVPSTSQLKLVGDTEAADINALKTASAANVTTIANTTGAQPQYHLPQWFISENIKTPLEPIEVSDLENHTIRDLKEYLLSDESKYLYEEMQDSVASTLVPDGKGVLPHLEFSVLVRSPDFTEELLNIALRTLAKDMGANLICLDVEDVEALSFEFGSQELSSGTPREDNTENSCPTSMNGEAEHFFGIGSRGTASAESWCRTKAAFSAILDGCTAKARFSTSEDATSDLSKGNQEKDLVAESSTPSIIHLREAKRIAETPYGHKFLTTMGEIVQERRASGDAIVVVISAAASAGSSRWWEDKEAEEALCLGKHSTVDLWIDDPRNHCQNCDEYIAVLNVRRLKTLLRPRISYICEKGLFDPPSSWARDDFRGGRLWPMGEKEWNVNQLRRVATQVIGRAFGKAHLDISDIRDIIIRNALWNEYFREECYAPIKLWPWDPARDEMLAAIAKAQIGEDLPSEEEFPTAESSLPDKDSPTSKKTEWEEAEAVSSDVNLWEETDPDEPRIPKVPDAWSDTPVNAGDPDGSEDQDAWSVTISNAEEPDDFEDPNAWTVTPSKAQLEWEAQKSVGEDNEGLDNLMGLVGLETVKARHMELKNLVDTANRQNVDLRKERFGTVLLGNPGVGKTTVAGMYAKFLSPVQVVPAQTIVETTGTALLDGGIPKCEEVINSCYERYRGGVILIDEAHHMVSEKASSVLSFIVSEMDRNQGEIVFVFAGYPKPMEALFASCPGLQSRIAHTINFHDYDDNELHQILVHRVKEKFSGRMRIEGGLNGLYTRIVARRIGRGRGKDSFGNAREVHKTLSQILFRQAKRLEDSRRLGQKPNDFFLTKVDLIGPPPSATLEHSKAWQSLQQMIGLDSVKRAVQALVDRLQVNYDREIAEQPLVTCSLNKVFLGNPGTGKTTVAKLYCQILVDIGLLSDSEIVVRSPADFIGSALGQTESLTKAILESTKGKGLVIDEAYAFSDETAASGSGNFYKSAAVDTLVAEVQSTASDDRCVLLLGYEDRMVSMFQNMNPALSRRFPMSSAFRFEDYDDEELREILDLKLNIQGFTATEQAKQTAMECLMRARNQKNFGNAGEVDILLDRAKEAQQMRLSSGATGSSQLEARDFDTDFERFDQAESNVDALFCEFVGAEALVEKLKGFQRMAQNCKTFGIDPRDQVPFNFLFRGPPGENSKLCSSGILLKTFRIW